MPHNAKTVRIAVLSRDKEEEKAIKEAFRAFDADLVLMPTIHRLRDLLFTQPCSRSFALPQVSCCRPRLQQQKLHSNIRAGISACPDPLEQV